MVRSLILIFTWAVSGYFLLFFKGIQKSQDQDIVEEKKKTKKKEKNKGLKLLKSFLDYGKLIVFAVITVILCVGFAANDIIKKQGQFEVKFENLHSRILEMNDVVEKVEKNSANLSSFFEKLNFARDELKKIDKLEISAREQASRLQALLEDANKELAQIQSMSEFSLVVTEALYDDRKAFERLKLISKTPNSLLQQVAVRIIYKIINDLKIPKQIEYKMNWDRLGFSKAQFTLKTVDELILVYKSLLAGSKLEFLDVVWNQRETSKAKCLEFMVYIIKTDSSLQITAKACEYLEQYAKLNKNILDYDDYIAWWDENKANFVEESTGVY